MTARAKTGVDDPAALAPSTAVSYLLALFDYLRLRQIDATELQRSLNVDLNDRDARVSELEAAELFNRAAVLAQDPDLGVHVAEHIRPGHYGVLGYVAMACTTLGEAMLAQQRYQGLVITVAPVDVRIDADEGETASGKVAGRHTVGEPLAPPIRKACTRQAPRQFRGVTPSWPFRPHRKLPWRSHPCRPVGQGDVLGVRDSHQRCDQPPLARWRFVKHPFQEEA